MPNCVNTKISINSIIIVIISQSLIVGRNLAINDTVCIAANVDVNANVESAL